MISKMITVQYHNDEERSQLIEQHSDLYLIRDAFTFEGMFLTFDVTATPQSKQDLESKVNDLSMTVDSILTDVLPTLMG